MKFVALNKNKMQNRSSLTSAFILFDLKVSLIIFNPHNVTL